MRGGRCHAKACPLRPGHVLSSRLCPESMVRRPLGRSCHSAAQTHLHTSPLPSPSPFGQADISGPSRKEALLELNQGDSLRVLKVTWMRSPKESPFVSPWEIMFLKIMVCRVQALAHGKMARNNYGTDTAPFHQTVFPNNLPYTRTLLRVHLPTLEGRHCRIAQGDPHTKFHLDLTAKATKLHTMPQFLCLKKGFANVFLPWCMVETP